MRFNTALLTLLLSSIAQCVKVVLSNDDGWAEINIRTLYDELKITGHQVILSAPAEDKSGTGSTSLPALPRIKPCEFDSCPAYSPAEGHNASDPFLNYVNSYPATAMRYGIQTLAVDLWNKSSGPSADLGVAGVNVGSNLGFVVFASGTVGAATAAAKLGVPAIAFSGATGTQSPWNAPPELYTTVYSVLAARVTDALVKGGKPYLPLGTWLNVNFPAVTDDSCSSPDDFKFVLSRLFEATESDGVDDADVCGSGRLRSETSVVDTPGCYASISVADSSSKSDANADQQSLVARRLGDFLSCLPS